MKARKSTRAAGVIVVLMTVLISAASGSAATFSLAWDPNCNADPTLTGYKIYYSAVSSVKADPNSAQNVYIPLDHPDFDPDHPSYKITDLPDDVVCYFAVAAVYKDGESDMSNEISGSSSNVTSSEPDTPPASDASTSTVTDSTSSTTSQTQSADQLPPPTLKVLSTTDNAQ